MFKHTMYETQHILAIKSKNLQVLIINKKEG